MSTVSKRLRYEVLRRDNHTCRYCGGTAPDVKITIDHVLPVSLGGSDVAENLVAACVDCNAGKAATNPDAVLVEDVQADAIRWAQAMRTASELLAEERAIRDAPRRAFEEAWGSYGWNDNRGRRHLITLPAGWETSIDAVNRAGLDEDEIVEAVAVAMARKQVNDRFRYFCGVAWTMVRKKQDLARSIATVESKWDEADS